MSKDDKKTTEIYVRISKGKGKKKDTVANAVQTKEEAIEFIKKNG